MTKRQNDESPKKRRRLKVRNKQEEFYTEEESNYYQDLPVEEKHMIANLEDRMSDMNNVTIPYRFKILKSDIDDKIKSVAMQKLDELNSLTAGCGEHHKISHYIKNLCKIPFGVYKKLGASEADSAAEFIQNIKGTMDSRVYGHSKAKDQIIRLLAQWLVNTESKGLVIGIQGAMGVGKTTLIKDAICNVLGLPFAFVPLGGVSDGSYLVGHGYTYEGSTWGRIVDILMNCGCMNPVFFFDELDKVSATKHGEEIVSVLIHMTDATQNERFHDKYFSNLEFDLSRSLIIFSYNDESAIHPVLKDRMVKIKTSGYDIKDKLEICKRHMIASILKEFGFAPTQMTFSDEIIKQIIKKVDKEQGVRNLKRALHDIISNINLERLLAKEPTTVETPTIIITAKHVDEFIPESKDDENISRRLMYI